MSWSGARSPSYLQCNYAQPDDVAMMHKVRLGATRRRLENFACAVKPQRRNGQSVADHFYNLGLEASLAFAGFGLFIKRQITDHQIERWFFLSREGAFLQRIVAAIPSSGN